MIRTALTKPVFALRAAVVVALFAAPLVAMPPGAPVQAAGPVFINELHYDNAGTDVGEFVEVAGPTGTDLSGWSIVLYNGSNGTAYDTITLAGTLADGGQGYGFEVVNLPTNGLQNGSPDGVALVDGGTVVEFLSYEGSFAAAGGPADGQASTDIGVSETSTTLVGESLQLVGSGTNAEDFTWSGPVAETPGAANTGQDFGGGGSPPPFIAEIHYDNVGADVGEFVEVAGPAGTDLNGWTLVPYNGSSGTQYSATALSGVIDDEGAGSGAVSFAIAGLQNGAPDGVALVDDTGGVVEFLSYEGSFDATDGPAVGLTSIDIVVSETSTTPVGESLQLIDGAWSGPVAESPGELNTGAPPGPVVVVAEIHYDNDGADVGEFVEVAGTAGTDLTGWSIVLYNGTNGTAYGAVDLSGSIDDEGAGSGAVSFAIVGLQNGSPDGLALIDGNGNVVEFLSYEGVLTAADGPAVGLTSIDIVVSETNTTPIGQSLQLIDGTWSGPAPESPGVLNAVAPADTQFIHDVQGSGAASPLVGSTVVVEGIVVGDFQDGAAGVNGDLDGFFVQEEDSDADADSATSEGIFVFDGSSPTVNVAIGDRVQVEGVVSEFFDKTQITSFSGVSVISTGNAAPTPASASLPVLDVNAFEAFEGMSVTFAQDLVISEYFNFDRFGEVVLTSQRNVTPTAEVEPGPAAIAEAEAYALDGITLDDGRTNQNPDPAIHPNGAVFDLTNLFRGGDTVADVTGVMDYGFGLYRIQPTQGADYANVNPRTAAPDPVGGRLQVATFNVLNYFTTLDNSGPICGPSADQDCRGADDFIEFTRQRDKIVSAIAAIDADVVGLSEIENNPGDVPTADLVAGLNDLLGAGTYDYVATGAVGTDAIRTALIYKPVSVSPSGAFAVLDSSVDPLFDDTRNRPVLAQTFVENATGAAVTVAVNHFKSKGSACGPGDRCPRWIGELQRHTHRCGHRTRQLARHRPDRQRRRRLARHR